MEEVEYHHHHHHHHRHHGHSTGDENQGHQHATSSEGPIHSVVTGYSQEHQQQNLTVPIGALNIHGNQTLGGVQPTNSFHSVSSGESAAEMSQYFPDTQTAGVTPFRHQQEVEGQAQSTTAVTTTINTVNAGPYIPASAPIAVQPLPQPIRAPFMAQQQRPIRPPGPPQLPPGIPSYSSQIEGLSVSQAVVNDVLIDLQTKVLNETLQQYQNESSSDAYLEPLPPIFIRAPQPTVILRSDLHRLRAELNSRVRPPVIFRHPGGANQFQQHRFQQNTFQTPRFPAPQQQFVPPGYAGYPNAAYASSDEYKTTTTTTCDEYRKEKEERLYNQAESPMLNDDNINDNVHHSAFDLQGLSTTSFDRHALPYESSSFLPNIGDQQQGNEETVLTSSHNINGEEVNRTDNMFSRPVRPRQEITFDINNCIYRCFEAHRQRVARRRAARQARRAKRHKKTAQQQQEQPPQQYQQSYHTDQYQNIHTQPTYSLFGNLEQTQWEQQQQLPTSSHYSDIITGLTDTSASVHAPQGPYISAQTYDYTNVAQATTSPTDVQTSGTDYYQFKNISAQEPYIESNTYDYTSHQTAPSTADFIQQPSIGQQVPTSVDYSNQVSYSNYSSVDATVPNEIQNLATEYYQQQQQQIPTQFIQNQGTFVQPSSTFEYSAGSAQNQIPTYDYQNIEQQSYQYPYNIENIQQQQPSFNYATIASSAYVPSETNIQQTEQNQTLDYTSQGFDSSNYYQQQPIPVPVSQVQGTFSQPTGTYEYSRESYQSQEPIYDYQGTDQQSSQYSYNAANIQQIPQQDSYNYANTVADTYVSPQIDSNLIGQRQTFDYSTQVLGSSDYYQQQPISLPTSQIQEAYTQSSDTFDYTTESAQTQQVPTYNYQNIEQQSYQYPYNIEDINQQSFDYTSGATSSFIPSETNIQQTEQNQTPDYTSQRFDSSNYYQQQPIHVPVSEVQEGYTQQSETFDYTTESAQTQQVPTYNYQNIEQQSYQYPYNIDNIQQQSFDYTSEAATTYVPPETNIQQPEQKQTFDYSNETRDTTDHYQQQQEPVNIPITQNYDSQLSDQRITGASVPTGTVEYTRQAYFSQEPLSDNYTTENFIEQYQQQQQQQEGGDSWNVNDYLKRFEAESYSEQTGGQIKSSDDLHSISTITTTPFIIQQNINIQPSQGATHTYDLQNYTNESIVSETAQPPLSSSIYEEDRQHLLQQQPEKHREREISFNETYSSLPPPPTTTLAEETDYQQESIATNTSEFPPPPTPDRHTYQITEQRPSRSYTSIIPSIDQPSIYTEQQPLQPKSPSSSDHGTDNDIKEEEEEIFDLRQCIANCYAKYQESWNKDEQQKYEQQIQGSQQPSSITNIINNQQFDQYQQRIPQRADQYHQTIPQQVDQYQHVNQYQQGIPQPIDQYQQVIPERINQYQQVDQYQQEIPQRVDHYQQAIPQQTNFITNKCPEQPRQYFGTGEIHYVDGWTQTPSLDVIKQDDIVQHKYDETPSTFDTKPYIPHLPTRDLTTDSRGQQTIEYSPPLITQTRHIIPSIPSSAPLPTYEYPQYEQQQQQQQQIYDHTLPVPPHLSFNDVDYQSNLYFPSQITDQPRQYQNLPYDTDEQTHQQRYRAYSEPASIQQDSLASNPPLQPAISQIIEQQQRAVSIPMINQQTQAHMPPVRLLDNGRSYETEAIFQRRVPRIDPRTGLCLVPCPETQKYAHLPPHLRPELFCVELPPPSALPPVPPPPPRVVLPPPPPPPPPVQQQQRWCVRCCCVPGQSLVKKVVYKQAEEEQQHEEAEYDYASVIDQMQTRITVRYGNSIMDEGEAFVPGNYHEQLRVIDFPVYVSGKNDPNLTPLVPVS